MTDFPTEQNTPYWQTDQRDCGAILTNAEDIDRCIENILLTPLRSVPHHPDFGADLDSFLDRPINSVRAPLIREIYRAIEKWESRVKIDNVTVSPDTENIAKLNIAIAWVLADSNTVGSVINLLL